MLNKTKNLFIFLGSLFLILLFSIFFNYYLDLNVCTYLLQLYVKTLNLIWFNLYKIFTTTLIIFMCSFFSLRDTSTYSPLKLALHYCVIFIVNLLLIIQIAFILDMIPTVEVLPGQSTQPNSSDINSSSGLFLILSKLSDKIPNWLKWMFRLLLLGVVLLNVFGFSSASTILVSTLLLFKMYTKIILISLCLLVIISQFLAIFILYWVKDKQELVLPFGKYTPNFLVDLLRNLKLISSTKESIDEFKTGCCIQIVLYLVIIILIVFIL